MKALARPGWFNKVFFIIVRLIYIIKQLYNETLLSGFKCTKQRIFLQKYDLMPLHY